MNIVYRVFLLVIVAAVFLLDSAYADSVNDSTKVRFVGKPDPRLTWGIDFSLGSGLNVPAGWGPWIGVGLSRDIRVRLRIRGTGFGEYFYPDDSVAFDWERSGGGEVDLEDGKLRLGRVSFPVGFMIGHERVSHTYRVEPFGEIVSHSDAHAVLEPWIGIRLNRGEEDWPRGIPLRLLSFNLGYRFPISPDLPGYVWDDLAGAVLYLRFSP